ncbi:DNA-binding SARP family transcriptional activator [Saccharothrix coeruleofusca]|uniref:AfsR/SARP family transcriptional regulator n=1 Tax=Saccharothrix coeruleofusca TaxID=33919 RepID=UPI001AE3EADD|nr:AfsR/SARP family transcriptional regulator [Saccharothrix coeruleofusca]MBP2337218.1 DNA-binding SARP family transcriptional activator [Saccharothrix coeruleofusca]
MDITPTAPKLRQLLALLALNAGVVRTDQIVDELWEDRPPLTATTTLQTYVYQLRRSLRLTGASAGEAGREVALHTTRGGYLLELPAGSLDVDQFRALVERGRAEAERGSLEAAATTLRDALRLWRGPVLADIRFGPVLQAEAVGLAEFARSVREQRFDIELQLGRHHEVIGELRAALAEQATNEGYQSKLMLALYRAGRRSEALQVYQDARAVLRAELAVEPCPELRRLHHAIMTGDPALDLAAPEATAPRARPAAHVEKPPELPCQLPPASPVLVGREAQVSALCAALTAPGRRAPGVAVVVGPPGVGKSVLAVRLAHQLRAEFPDGQLYARLVTPAGRPADPVDVLGDFLSSCGRAVPATASVQERVRAFRSWTADQRVLVVLDDVVSDDQLRPLLPIGLGCAALVVARRRLTDPSIMRTVRLAPLDAMEALELMVSVLGRRRVAAEADAAVQLVTMCGGLPLALRAALWWLELRPHWSVRRLVHRVGAAPQLLLEPGPPELDLLASVARTTELLPAAARVALRWVSLVDGRIVPGDLAAAIRLGEADAEALLDELVEFGLLEVEQPSEAPAHGAFRYRCHPVIRRVVDLLEADAEAGPPVFGPNLALNVEDRGVLRRAVAI